MELPTAKQLAALAKACRKAGITSFKGAGIEFTLEALPQKVTGSKSKAPAPVDLGENVIETDELSPQSLMFWSVGESQTEGNEQ